GEYRAGAGKGRRMEGEVNGRAGAVSPIEKRWGGRGAPGPAGAPRRYLFPAVPTRAPAAPSAAKKRRSAVPPIEVSGYGLPNGFHAPRGGIRTNHRSMISSRQLAQNEKRKDEHDACHKDRYDIGKRRCTVSRSKFRCLIPRANQKCSCRSPSRDGQPGSQPNGRCRFPKEMGAPLRGNNSAASKRTVRHR